MQLSEAQRERFSRGLFPLLRASQTEFQIIIIKPDIEIIEPGLNLVYPSENRNVSKQTCSAQLLKDNRNTALEALYRHQNFGNYVPLDSSTRYSTAGETY